MSAVKEKKLAYLADLYKELQVYKLVMVPEFMNGGNTIRVLSDDKLNEKEYVITMDNLNTVTVVATYFEAPYDKTIESRRDAIKTCKDIFEFSHDLQAGDYSRVDPSLKDKSVPRLSLYYRNVSSENKVVVTSTIRFNATEFLFRGCEILHEISSNLYQLTKLIEQDNNGAGKHLRWEKPVKIGKNWWSH